MNWIKKGLIFKPDNNYDWMQTHAQIPIAHRIGEDRLRIYFGTRDKYNRTVTTYIEVEADNPQNVLYVHNKPVLPLGKLGCFDDSGAMPSWIVDHDGMKYLFYTGWSRGITVPYYYYIGLALSNDGSRDFERLSEAPILGRHKYDPYLTGSPCVLLEDSIWKVWYISCTGWIIENNKPEPLYLVKYAESQDGMNWIRTDLVCIDYKFDKEAIARPCVIKENSMYKMWYCYRGSIDYRTDKEQSYRIGYAESFDGINWIRKDKEAGIDRSGAGWDSEMMAYPYVYEHKGMKYMLYNGNGFGKSGFGYAVLEEK